MGFDPEQLNDQLSDATLSTHAEERRESMGLTRDDVLLVIADYEVCYEQSNYDDDETVFKRDDLSVVFSIPNNTVITVLYNTQENYER